MTDPRPKPPQDATFPPAKMKPFAAAVALAYAGFPPDQWATGVAVGMGESGLDLGARNPKTDSVGWLQINRNAHPDLFKNLQSGYEWLAPEIEAKFAKKVYDNAHGWGPWQAYTGPDGKGSDGPWRQYQAQGEAAAAQLQKALAGKSPAERKKYLQSQLKIWDQVADALYLGVGTQMLGNDIADAGQKAGDMTVQSGAAVADSVKSLMDEFASISHFFQALLLPSTWIRVGAGTVGAILIVVGMIALGKEASAAQ